MTFNYITSAEIREKEKNNTHWELRHYFNQGWVWYRGCDKVKIFFSDLAPFQITFKYFPHIDPALIEEIVAIRKEKERKKSEWRKANPITIGKFSEFSFPIIKKAFPLIEKTFPTNPITELVGVHPIKCRPEIVFNNKPTLQLLRDAYNKEYVIISRYKTVKESILAAKRIKRMPKKYHSRIAIWFTPENQKAFEERMTKTINTSSNFFLQSTTLMNKDINNEKSSS